MGKRARSDDCLEAIDRYFAKFALRYGREERFGPLSLFVAEVSGALLHARPSGGEVTKESVETVLQRQRQLGMPEAFEWIDQRCPELTALLSEQGLVIEHCPLLVLDHLRPPNRPLDDQVSLVELSDADPALLASAISVAEVAFANRRARKGPAGPAERDALAATLHQARLERTRRNLASGATIMTSAIGRSGPLSVGSAQIIGDVAEITGVGTLPIARERGLASMVTSALAASLVARGVGTIFLSAANDEVASLYARLGFELLGGSMLARRAV